MSKRRMSGRRAVAPVLGFGLVLGLIPVTGAGVYAAAVEPEAHLVVGDTELDVSLEEALENMEDEGTIYLRRNVVISGDKTYQVNENVNSFTMDLNGYELIVEGTLTSANDNACMVVDSSTPGLFESSGTINVDIQGFTGDEYRFTGGTVSSYFTLDGGTATITGGEFTGGLMVDNGGSADVSFVVSGNAMIQGMELYAMEGENDIAITLAGGYYDSDPSVVDDNTAECLKIEGTLQQYSDSMSNWEADTETYAWRIRPLTVEDAEISIPEQTYTGRALQPEPEVVLNGVTLKKNEDFTVSYANNTNVGSATAVIAGAGEYSGEKEVPFEIKPMLISSCDAWTVPNYSEFTGDPATPKVRLWNFGNYTQLVEGTDFEITGYSDNTDEGVAKATVTGKGNFTGTKEVPFHIVDMSRYAYVKPKTNYVTVGEIPLGSDGKVTKGNVDLTVGFEINSEIKEAEFYALVTSPDGKSGILAGPLTTMRPEEGDTYGGYRWTPSPDDGDNCFTYSFKVATLGAEDTQQWSESSDGWVYVDGAKEGDEIGVYASGYLAIMFDGEEKALWIEAEGNTVSFEMTGDSSKKTFEAAAAMTSLEDAEIAAIAGQTYTGKKIEPEVTVTCGDSVLEKGTDFTVAYTNNVNVGIATVTVTGTGNYDGELTGTFVISGWEQKDKNWYYFGLEGEYETGWKQIGGKWYFFDTNGVMATGWRQISGKWYYFKNGVMQNGWCEIGGKWYYFKSGVMQNGWCNIGGDWYYFKSGAMATDWLEISKKWYYFGKNGIMRKSWQKISRKWYFFGTDGAMRTGWCEISKKWYFFKNGVMTTGWLKLGNNWFYFDGSGAMVTGQQKIGGKTYSFDNSGVCLNP